MNILKFISSIDINCIEDIQSMPISFKMIDLHTKDFQKAKSQCDDFFDTKQEVGSKVFYYTNSSDYQWYGGWEYELVKSKNGGYWLLLKNNEKIEI